MGSEEDSPNPPKTLQEPFNIKSEPMDVYQSNSDDKNDDSILQKGTDDSDLTSQDTSLSNLENQLGQEIDHVISKISEECCSSKKSCFKGNDQPSSIKKEQIEELQDHSNNYSDVKDNPHSSNEETMSQSLSEMNSYDARNSVAEPILCILYLPTNWSQKQIKDFMEEECGPVTKIDMPNDLVMDFMNIGVVEVEFENMKQCRNAKKILNGKEVQGIKLRAYCINEDNDENSARESEYTEPRAKKRKRQEEQRSEDIDAWDIDPTGLYGLQPTYLKLLGISPPITNWVNVTNFRSDKWELKEVLELAGKVMICKVVHGIKKYAKVMYSHPLEAVQAVSMLHNQQFYGAALKVIIDTNPNTGVIIPNGLTAVGSGLGSFGKPLVDIVKQYERHLKERSSAVDTTIFRSPKEIQIDLLKYKDQNQQSTSKEAFEPDLTQFKRSPDISSPQTSGQNISPLPDVLFKRNQSQSPQNTPANLVQNISEQSNVVPRLDQNIPTIQPAKPKQTQNISGSYSVLPSQFQQSTGPQNFHSNPVQNVSLQNAPFHQTQNIPSQLHNPPIRNPHIPQNIPRPPMVQGLQFSQGPGPQFGQGSLGPPVRYGQPNPLANASGPTIQPGNNAYNQVTPTLGPQPVKNEYFTVQLTNLPLSTTFPLLSEKMSACGPILSLQLTAPGCARVQFSHRACADRCFQLYNNVNVNGNVIRVAFM